MLSYCWFDCVHLLEVRLSLLLRELARALAAPNELPQVVECQYNRVLVRLLPASPLAVQHPSVDVVNQPHNVGRAHDLLEVCLDFLHIVLKGLARVLYARQSLRETQSYGADYFSIGEAIPLHQVSHQRSTR